MSARAISEQHIAETIQRVEECLREGFTPPWRPSSNSAILEAGRRAAADGFVNCAKTFRNRLAEFARSGIEPDWSIWRAPVYQRPENASAKLDQHPISPVIKPGGKPIKVCVIGDAHDDPRLEDKSRFTWMGRWCSDVAPDYIVQLGDWGTFDSMSRHAEKGSLAQRAQPSFMQDVESLYESVHAFDRGLGGGSATKIFTAGNHEDRVGRYENSNPDVLGALVPQWRGAFHESGWRIHEYGEYAFIDNVGFTHHPVNGMGRAYGGKTGNQRAGNDSVFSIVHGHDHKLERVSSPKVGPYGPVEIISAGCSLPWGWVEPYAKLSPSGWWWGVIRLTIQNGQITDMDAVSMLTLESRYADKSSVAAGTNTKPDRKKRRSRSQRSRTDQ